MEKTSLKRAAVSQVSSLPIFVALLSFTSFVEHRFLPILYNIRYRHFHQVCIPCGEVPRICIQLLIFAVFFMAETCAAQQKDSLKTVFGRATQAKHKIELAVQLVDCYKDQPDSAIFYAHQALAQSKNLANTGLTGKALNAMGKALIWQKNAKEGALYLDSALLIARTSRDSTAVAGALYNIGKMYYYTDNYSQAVTHVQQMLRELGPYIKKLKREDTHAIYELLGVCLKKTGQYNAALDAYQMALETAIDPSIERGRTLLNIKNVFLVKGDYHTALTYALESIKVFEKTGNQLAIAVAISGVSDIYMELENYEPALHYQRTILKMYHSGEIMDVGLKGIVFTNLGFCYLNLPEHLDSSFYYLNQAANIFIINGNRASLSEVYSFQGEAYLKKGDFAMAETKYYEAQNIANAIGYEARQCSNYLLLAKIYFNTGAYPKAIPMLHKVLSCAKVLEQAKTTMEAHQYLAQVYEARGQYGSALFYYKSYYALKDSIVGRQAIFKVTNLEKKVALEKQATEENRLALEMAKTENKLNQSWIISGIVSSILLFLIGALVYYQYIQANKNVKNLRLYIEQLNKTKNKIAPLLASQLSNTEPIIDMDSISHSYIQKKIDELDLYIEKLIHANPEQNTMDQQHQILQHNQKIIEELKTLNYSISHDLMAPISRIQHIARDLQIHLDENMIGAENSAKLTSIALAASQSGKMLLQLLEFSKLEHEVFDFATLNSQELLRDIIQELSFMASKQKVAIIIDNTLPTFHADVFAIRRVFTNLLQNAIKYSQKIYNPEVHISATVQNGWVTFYIHDNGPGFSALEKDKIFRPFYRIAPYQTIGNGMGLAIAKRIVEKHAGKIWAHSQPNEGATFAFTIPIEHVKEVSSSETKEITAPS